ncbi:MAG: cation diffusion facilitator family transporter, partial [Phycisphaerae bacterium]
MRDARKTVMRISLAASALMLSGKSVAYFLTNSTAILSDALESIVHGFATGFAALSLWYAAQPADENHPYGHGRIAYFSAGFEGSLVMMASLSIMYSGVSAFIHGVELDRIGYGLGITGLLACINLVLGYSLIRVGKAHNELILIANGRHVLSDMWTSIAAIVGLVLVVVTGWTWLDPLTALL